MKRLLVPSFYAAMILSLIVGATARAGGRHLSRKEFAEKMAQVKEGMPEAEVRALRPCSCLASPWHQAIHATDGEPDRGPRYGTVPCLFCDDIQGSHRIRRLVKQAPHRLVQKMDDFQDNRSGKREENNARLGFAKLPR